MPFRNIPEKPPLRKALIIDDEIDICYLLSSILRTKNLQVKYVNSLSEAADALDKQAPEIIFLDNHLPDGLGVDFITQLKTTHPDIKVVMLTAFDNYSDRSKAFENGVDTFISKPFNKTVICQAVENLLRL